ncbi:MAG TPA: SCP2 sterol-binding domain-containing protein [Myxococcales bacterium]
MARSFEEIIAEAKAKHFDERAKTIRGNYRFDVEGQGSYRIEVDRGRIAVREDSGPADCVIALGAEDFVRVIEGEQNMITAYMQGRLRIDGSLGLAKAFHGAIGIPRAQQPQGVRP